MRSRLKNSQITSLWIFVVFIVLRTISYDYFSTTYDSFGYEYGNIAEALIKGYGFSNPFPNLTDNNYVVPTAWSPVSYTFYHWMIFKVAGVRTIEAFWLAISLRGLLLILSFWLILNLLPHKPLYHLLALVLFMVYSHLLSFEAVFDFAQNSFLSIAGIFIVVQLIQGSSIRTHLMLLLPFTVLITLSNLSIALALFLFLIFLIIGSPSYRLRSLYLTSIALMIVTGVIVGLWNQQKLGKFIPYKSNLWFEFYMSNIESESGLLKRSYFAKFHPYNNEDARKRYVVLGEVSFLEDYEKKSKSYIVDKTADYIKKIFNRAINSFIFTVNYDDRAFLPESLSTHDLKLLESNRLALAGMWHVQDVSDEKIIELINSNNFNDPTSILDQIQTVKNDYRKRLYYEGLTLKLGIASLCIIPTIALILSFLTPKIRQNPVFTVTLFFFLISSGIYIGVSHYERYQYFHMVHFTIFISLYVGYLLEKFTTQKTN